MIGNTFKIIGNYLKKLYQIGKHTHTAQTDVMKGMLSDKQDK